ncbi:contact-dependent growth inhibition system immunity protein [Lentzea sp. NPDC059081]|uniref:contact-dependent growth inhibition system immunity protein n=1 Tax=Lentzea sp. NPDC059081 TaxID=3346719 RepID=UPI0036BDBD4E
MRVDRDRTLAHLSDDDWRRPDSSSTQLYRDLCALRDLPVGQLTPTSLHLLVTHQVGLDVTALLALEHVECDPLRSVALYPGDLLAALLRVDHSFWSDHPQLLARMSALLDRLRTLPEGDWRLLVSAAEQFPG